MSTCRCLKDRVADVAFLDHLAVLSATGNPAKSDSLFCPTLALGGYANIFVVSRENPVPARSSLALLGSPHNSEGNRSGKST